jgi:uncharacterized peroxidase-related enzyme
MTEYSTHLPPIDINQAEPLAKAVLDKALSQVGFIPNMYSNMANMPGLLNTYLTGYAAFREQGEFSSAEQEVVFLTISRENECHYCVAAHSMLADTMSGVATNVTNAIREGSEIEDSKLSVLHDFTHHMLTTQGKPSNDAVQTFLASGFSERQILAIILAIAVKTLSNYSNHIFDTELDAMFQDRSWHK